MAKERLSDDDLARFLSKCPHELPEVVLELRELILEAAPSVHEKIAFNSLCYYKPDRSYGVIGGNVCGIGWKNECVHLGFIHGAALPDPQHRLQGTGKAKRHLEIHSVRDIPRRYLEQLIRAALEYEPR